jgi:hypothetical protein
MKEKKNSESSPKKKKYKNHGDLLENKKKLCLNLDSRIQEKKCYEKLFSSMDA